MSGAKKITEFLDQAAADDEKVAVQGYVPAQLRADVLDQMKKDKTNGIKTNWNLLLESCLRSYLSERKSKRG